MAKNVEDTSGVKILHENVVVPATGNLSRKLRRARDKAIRKGTATLAIPNVKV